MPSIRRIRFRVALWLWARLIPLLAWKRDLGSLLALTKPGSRTPYQGFAAEYIARRVQKTTRHPRLMRDRPCLRQGVLALRFLQLAGFRPTLHFAVNRGSVKCDVLSAHCWVALDGRTILNPPSASMVEVLTFTGGRLLPPSNSFPNS